MDLSKSAKINPCKMQEKEEIKPPLKPSLLTTPVLSPRLLHVVYSSWRGQGSSRPHLFPFSFSPLLSPKRDGETKQKRWGGGDGIKIKKNPERERKRSDWGDKGQGKEGGEGGGWWREDGGARFRGLMCVFDSRPASSYANTANFPFYFISGAEICDLW